MLWFDGSLLMDISIWMGTETDWEKLAEIETGFNFILGGFGAPRWDGTGMAEWGEAVKIQLCGKSSCC